MAADPAALDRHASLTLDLAALLRERGDLQALALTAYSDAWRDTTQYPVTERRETCKEASARFESEILKLSGEIDALRAELNHCELLLQHGST